MSFPVGTQVNHNTGGRGTVVASNHVVTVIEYPNGFQNTHPTTSAITEIPTEGVDRCVCGSKYWDGVRCHDCQERFVR